MSDAAKLSRPGSSFKRWIRIATASGLLLLAGCSPEAREASHMAKGHKYLDSKEYKKAVIEFKVAAQNMPRDAEPVYQLGMTYLVAGAGKPAYDAFQKAMGLDSKHEGAQFELALFKAGSAKPGTLAEARQVLTAYLGRHPDDAEALGGLALAEAKLGNKAEALRLLNAAAEKDSSKMRPAGIVIALYAAKGDTATATEIARSIAERAPKSPEAAVLCAEVSLATHDTAGADAQITRALALKRDFRPALQLRLRRELMTRDTKNAEETTRELSQLPQKQMWTVYGRMLFAEHKVDQGMAEFQKVLKEHNDSPELRDQYSGLLAGAGRAKEAEDILAGTLLAHPKDAPALLQRAALQIDKGDLESAAKDLKKLLEMEAFSAQLSYQQSRIFGARGDTARQGDLLAQALQRDPKLLPARLELSRLLTNAGKTQNALTILDQASPEEKRSKNFVFSRNMALMSAGNWEEARKSVSAALAAAPAPSFLYQDATLRLHNHDVSGARKSLETAFRLAPTDTNTLILLGEVMRQQGESPKYAAMLKEAASKHLESAGLQGALGFLLAKQGDNAGAKAAFEAQRAAGDGKSADTPLALLDIRNGAPEQAGKRLLESIKAHDNAPARILLADIEGKRGNTDAAIQHYLKAVQMEPTNVPALNNLAEAIASGPKKYDDSLFWAQKALALAPGSPVIQDTVGWILYRQGKYAEALPFLEKSLGAADRPVAHYHLAAALAKAGDTGRARREYNSGVKQDPKSPARTAIVSLFEGN